MLISPLLIFTGGSWMFVGRTTTPFAGFTVRKAWAFAPKAVPNAMPQMSNLLIILLWVLVSDYVIESIDLWLISEWWDRSN